MRMRMRGRVPVPRSQLLGEFLAMEIQQPRRSPRFHFAVQSSVRELFENSNKIVNKLELEFLENINIGIP